MGDVLVVVEAASAERAALARQGGHMGVRVVAPPDAHRGGRLGGDQGVQTQAWEPLGTRSAVLARQIVRAAAERLGRTPAQIVLRWHIQSGGSAVPKTAAKSRLPENLDVFDWELPDAVMRELDGLDEGGAGRVDPNTRVVL